MDTSLFTYKMADSFTPQELKQLKSSKKISDEVYNGAIEIQRSWKQSHPTMKIGHGAYRKEMTTFLDKSLKEAPTYPTNQKLRMFRTGKKKASEETIQQGLSKLPGLDSYYIDVSERDTGEWRIQFRRTRRELPSAHWNTAIKFVKSIGGKIVSTKMTTLINFGFSLFG